MSDVLRDATVEDLRAAADTMEGCYRSRCHEGLCAADLWIGSDHHRAAEALRLIAGGRESGAFRAGHRALLEKSAPLWREANICADVGRNERAQELATRAEPIEMHAALLLTLAGSDA